MLTDIKSFFELNLSPKDGRQDRHSKEVKYAAAALLVVCAKADFEHHPDEQRAIIELLEKTFHLDQEQIDQLLACIEEDEIVKSLQQITQLVNKHYSLEDKEVLVDNLWTVAYADGRLDQFEEQFISRVAFMIDMPQSRVQACRRRVAGEE